MRFGILFALALFIGVPLIEVAVFIRVGGVIGVWPTIGLCLLTAAAGTGLIRWQGLGLLQTAQREMDAGRPPVLEVFAGICLLLAGALLLTPGFFTDAIGFLLLVPPVRVTLYKLLGRRLHRHAEATGKGPGGGPKGPARRPEVIEGEYEEVDSDDTRPPRGGWGPRR